MTVTNGTVSANAVGRSLGGLGGSGVTGGGVANTNATLGNTIVALNTAPSGSPDISGSVLR